MGNLKEKGCTKVIKMANFNLFRIKYEWYEGDCGEILIGKKVSVEEFENELIKAKDFAKSLSGKKIKSGDYLGKGYRVECLPEVFEQILWYLTEKEEYIECSYDESVCYDIDDNQNKKVTITKLKKKTESKEVFDKDP